jgi:hypothetical protein
VLLLISNKGSAHRCASACYTTQLWIMRNCFSMLWTIVYDAVIIQYIF